jgi:hypothetical protein
VRDRGLGLLRQRSSWPRDCSIEYPFFSNFLRDCRGAGAGDGTGIVEVEHGQSTKNTKYTSILVMTVRLTLVGSAEGLFCVQILVWL